MLKSIQQGKLINKNGPQCKPSGVDQAFGWHLGMTSKIPLNCSLRFSMAVERNS
jgi:hypothetical protein